MKRLFTFALFFAVVSIGTSYAQKVRKTWDFRNGFSAATVNGLATDMEQNGAEGSTAHWRSYEKAGGKPGTESYWNASKPIATNADGNIVYYVDGEAKVIEELEGLTPGGMGDRNFVITYNATQKEFADSPNGLWPYGKSYIWLNGKKKTLTFKAEKGQNVRIGIESHKNSEARGITVSANGTTIEPTEGTATPITFNEAVFPIPDDTPDVTDYTDVVITSTNGCHIYYIIVGNGDDPNSQKTKIGYLYNGTTDGDATYQLLTANEKNSVTAIDVTGDISSVTADSLRGFDVTVAAPGIPADNAIVGVLKDAMPWTPVLNFNASFYKAWGYGEAQTVEGGMGATTQSSSQLFSGMTLIPAADAGLPEGQSGIVFTNGTSVDGVTLGNHFADDDILATAAGATEPVLIHAHNIYHNGYLYLPYSAAAMADAYNEGDATTTLLNNAVTMLADSKTDITSTPAPEFSAKYGNFSTTVTITDANSKADIYYTTDGTEPTETSTRYEAPFTVNAATTVKAIARAEGYNLSAVSDSTFQVYEQTKPVSISISQADDKATVTLSCATEGAQIWYNFGASADTTMSIKYTAPFVIRDHATLTTFATCSEYVQSDTINKEIFVLNDKVYIDEASHFDANYSSLSNGAGLFSWGKNAVSMYDETKDPIGTKTDEDGVEVPVYPEREVAVYPADDATAEWVVKSQGQSVLWQNISVGKSVGDLGGYNPATASDLDTLVTKYDVQFYKFMSGEYNARIESTKKFQGPFGIVTFLGNASATGSVQRMALQTSTDGTTWTTLGDTIIISNPQRLYTKVTALYSGSDEVYVRLAHVAGNSGCQCYDIYVMTEGEKSKAEEEKLAEAYKQWTTGIKTINNSQANATVKAIYNVNGMQLGNMQRGINILRMSDGTTRKVLVK